MSWPITARGTSRAEEAGELIRAVGAALGRPELEFHPGVSYRHLLVWRGGPVGTVCHPPHDFSGGSIAAHWPSGPGAEVLGRLIEESWIILEKHPINQDGLARGYGAGQLDLVLGPGAAAPLGYAARTLRGTRFRHLRGGPGQRPGPPGGLGCDAGARRHRLPRQQPGRQGRRGFTGLGQITTSLTCTSRRPTRPATRGAWRRRSGPSNSLTRSGRADPEGSDGAWSPPGPGHAGSSDAPRGQDAHPRTRTFRHLRQPGGSGGRAGIFGNCRGDGPMAGYTGTKGH